MEQPQDVTEDEGMANAPTNHAAYGDPATSKTRTEQLFRSITSVVFDKIRALWTLGTLSAGVHSRACAAVERGAASSAGRLGWAGLAVARCGGEVVFVDLDSTHRQVYGYAKQGAAVGRLKGRKTLHPLIATVSTRSPHGCATSSLTSPGQWWWRPGCATGRPPMCAGRPGFWPTH